MAFSFDPSQPPDAVSRFALIRAKVERAKKNLVDMEDVLHKFHKKIPRAETYIKPRFSDSGEQIEYNIPFDCLAAAGDVVNNLRASLDHLAYQLADVYTPNCPDDVLERTCFPIGKDAASYETIRKRIEKLVHPDAIKLMDEIKPYKGGNEALWLLNELNNISKHRVTLTVGETVWAHADWIGEYGLGGTFFRYKIKGPHFWGIYAYPAEHGYVQSPLGESLGNPQVFGGDALIPTLHHLIEVVEALLKQFLVYLK